MPGTLFFFFFSSRRRHTRCSRDWSSDVCSSDLGTAEPEQVRLAFTTANFLPLLAEKPQLGRFFAPGEDRDRKSTRLNSSHGYISYAVFCLKKKRKNRPTRYRNCKRRDQPPFAATPRRRS